MRSIKEVASNYKACLDPRLKSYKDIVSIEDVREKIRQKYGNMIDYLTKHREILEDTTEINQVSDQINAVIANMEQEIARSIPWPRTLGDFFFLIDQGELDGADLFKGKINPSQTQLKLLILSGITILAIFKLWNTKLIFDAEKEKKGTSNHLQEKMIGVASYIESIKQLNDIVKSNSDLADHISSLTHIENLIHRGPQNTKTLNKLIELLDHNTFQGNPSFFSLTGRILAAHQLMKEVKDEFIPALEAAGELDAYLSVAKLYKEHADKDATFSFVNLVESNTPSISATDFWNPFIDPEIVVTNSIELGTNGQPNNVILSGPNTGGKSTVIKALLLNLHLAQSFGIAPARNLIFTPFTILNCYLNITDDITAGTSLFKAEVLRAKALINAIQNLKEGQFGFTIMDEVFSGTSPKEGEEAANMFVQELGEFDKSILILATHFLEELPKLADKGNHRLLQVKVIKHEDGRLERLYKLEEGLCNLNIAMDLLREEGVL